jgi:hypothetical protein
MLQWVLIRECDVLSAKEAAAARRALAEPVARVQPKQVQPRQTSTIWMTTSHFEVAPMRRQEEPSTTQVEACT